VQYKAWVCSRSLAGIVCSNPTGGMDVCLLWMLCVVRQRSLRRTDHSSRGILPSAVCLSVIMKPRQWGCPDPLGAVAPGWKKYSKTEWSFSIICVIRGTYIKKSRRKYIYLFALSTIDIFSVNNVTELKVVSCKTRKCEWVSNSLKASDYFV
jgi:hypothetical protein